MVVNEFQNYLGCEKTGFYCTSKWRSSIIFLFSTDPDNERVLKNKFAFEDYVAEGGDEENEYIAERPLGRGEFPHFYYTPDENDYDRYFTEKKLWQKLCRGETKPIVSFFSDFS